MHPEGMQISGFQGLEEEELGVTFEWVRGLLLAMIMFWNSMGVMVAQHRERTKCH